MRAEASDALGGQGEGCGKAAQEMSSGAGEKSLEFKVGH